MGPRKRHRRGSRRNSRQCSASLYGLIRTRLEQIGRPIGGNDLLIAAQAVALGHTIVTDKQSEFARIDGLLPENWLA